MRADWKYCLKKTRGYHGRMRYRKKNLHAYVARENRPVLSLWLFFSDCVWKWWQAFFFFFFCCIALRHKLFLLKHTDVAFTECGFFNWKKSWKKFEVKKFLCHHHIIDNPLKTPKNMGIKLSLKKKSQDTNEKTKHKLRFFFFFSFLLSLRQRLVLQNQFTEQEYAVD